MTNIENEGYQAFWQNEDVNPYMRDSDEWYSWTAGYQRASQDCDEYWDEHYHERELNLLNEGDELYPREYSSPEDMDW